MRSSRLIPVIVLSLCSGSLWAAFPGLRYLDEIGHLDTPADPRMSVQFGPTRVVSTGNGNVHFQGRDDDGNSWRAVLPIEGGIGFTTVWQADFDHNSRPDLLIAAFFPGNGRCIDEVTLSFLLFDRRGRPVPWTIRTRMPHSSRFPPIPAILTDSNRNGRAELVVTDCTYGEPPGLGEDRRITGIYEAKDATWSLARPARLGAYTALVRQNHRFRPQQDRLLPPSPSDWLNRGNELDPDKAPPVQVAAVLTASTSCRGPVHLPPLIDGRFQVDWKDPCDEIGHNRIQLSTGTVCYGWPTVVLDRSDGREISAESDWRDPPPTLLQKIVKEQRTVVLAGQTEPNRCSPALLWAPRTR